MRRPAILEAEHLTISPRISPYLAVHAAAVLEAGIRTLVFHPALEGTRVCTVFDRIPLYSYLPPSSSPDALNTLHKTVLPNMMCPADRYHTTHEDEPTLYSGGMVPGPPCPADHNNSATAAGPWTVDSVRASDAGAAAASLGPRSPPMVYAHR